MAIFAVLSEEPNAKLEARLDKMFEGDLKLKISDSQWLVVADKLAGTLADEIGIKKGEYGRVIVLRASSSGSGWHRKSIWDWLNLQAERS
jgi:hypothetical protein